MGTSSLCSHGSRDRGGRETGREREREGEELSHAFSLRLGVSYLGHLPEEMNLGLAKDEVTRGMMFCKDRRIRGSMGVLCGFQEGQVRMSRGYTG